MIAAHDRRARSSGHPRGRARAMVWAAVVLAGFSLAPHAAATHAAPTGEAPATDVSAMPSLDAPPVVAPARADGKPVRAGGHTVGWTAALVDPPLRDARRRSPRAQTPDDFGATLGVGERFRFDVTFAGNSAGLAEATVVAIEADPRGGPPSGAPILRLEGHASTSGIVSLLATVTDDMVTLLDARSGATVWSENVLVYGGWSPVGYKRRVTTASYEGRGQVRIDDVKDGKSRKHLKRTPVDTFDPLGAMAWVRAQRLEPGDRAKTHVIDGTTLMRIEVEALPRAAMERMPSVAKALGLGKHDVVPITGTLTRVDPFDQPLPGKRVFTMRAWLSADARRIPLAMESDMWVGALRLELTSYDPPTRAEGDRSR
ncbi:MAG: DUF3108 domain-containing protein [Deltaproteobacteria bacterium]|nr:DUF3108 domain-containing protein [Deltaproteobacteria bacterium]MBK8719117.1 DUF3108 domain-containing protein [Deltaproteobacteria bacterium]